MILIGPHDLAESMGIREPNDPRLRRTIEEIADRLRRVGRACLGFSLNHPMLPMTVAELKRLGVVYTSIQPPLERQILITLRNAVQAVRQAERGTSAGA
jgi:2-keto-3-deoxy-L-rhamnonate aldolase RhmA